ncbi:MAG: DUF4174 domain-containing protein [Thermoflexibacter sp.]
MSKIIKTVALLCIPMLTFSQSEDILQPYMWKNRLLLVFATSDKNLDYQKQMSIIAKASTGFVERHLIVFSIFENHGITSTNQSLDFHTCKKLYEKFKISKDNFTVVLIGKDGGEKYRKNATLTSEELFAIIDAMPMRKAEMKH